jgi:hypothetical protein
MTAQAQAQAHHPTTQLAGGTLTLISEVNQNIERRAAWNEIMRPRNARFFIVKIFFETPSDTFRNTF